MANALFSFEEFHSNGDQAHFPGLGRPGEAIKAKQDHFHGTAYWGDINYLCSDYNFSQDANVNNRLLASKDFAIPYWMHADPVYMEIQSLQEPMKFNAGPDCHLENSCVDDTLELVEYKGIKEHIEPKKEKVHPISSTTLKLLKRYTTGCKRLNGEKLIDSSNEETCFTGGRQLSTEEVVRVAAACYIQLSDHVEDDLSMLIHPSISMLSNLTYEENKDVELTHLLLAAAEKISNQQYDRARKLLAHCYYLSSNEGNPVQRVVYHFAGALQEKIDRETGRMSSKGMAKSGKWGEHIDEDMMGPHPALLACHKRLPFSKVMQFTEIQAILDSVGSAKKIHLIDLGLRIGIQWTTLIQALAVRVSCPLEHLKISAVGTSEEKIMKTSEWLVSFAKTMNLPFSFKAVILSDIKDIKEYLLEVESDEVVGIYAPMILWPMLVRPDCLENLMKVMKKLNPSIMIVTEVEANHNSPSFINRFTEALFFYSAWFDCLDTCMDKNDSDRMLVEENFFSHGIRSMVATEGNERIIRHVGIDVWRSFIKRFGFVETELSQLSLDQANLVVKQLPFGSCCTVDMNEKALTLGWKGAPLLSVSAWKSH